MSFKIKQKNKKLLAFVVPTGIGAKIGGFAGDASFWARKFSTISNLIVNPNVVNGACFSSVNQNMIYLEGSLLNRFLKNEFKLEKKRSNKIGLVFDCEISKSVLNVHINTINAMKTVLGLEVSAIEITKAPVGVGFSILKSGVSSGFVNNPKTLIESAKVLLEKGIEAIGIVCRFPQTPEDDYINANDVDIVGGIEAVISHFLCKEFNIVFAHAPAFDDVNIETKIVNPKVASEYITPTFLPCIIQGLQYAPKLVFENDKNFFANKKLISLSQLEGIILPYGCLGSSLVFDAVENGIEVFTIKENPTVLNVDEKILNLEKKIKTFDTYQQCFEYLKPN